MVAHPTRLYQLAPNLHVTIRRGTFGDMALETNADGLRERSLDVLRKAPIRVLAVGNSFAFGTGITQADAWPARLELELRKTIRPPSSVVVINAGVPAYGLTQIRDLTEELLPRVAPRLLLVGVYAGGFDRMRDPFTVLQDFVIRRSQLPNARVVSGGLVTSTMVNPGAQRVDLWLETHTYLGAYVFEETNRLRGRLFSRSDRAAYTALQREDSALALQEGLAEIRRINQDARAKGITVVVVLSAGFDEHNRIYPEQKRAAAVVQRFCAEQGIRFFDPTERLEASGVMLRVNPADQHLSAAANALVAAYLSEYIKDAR